MRLANVRSVHERVGYANPIARWRGPFRAPRGTDRRPLRRDRTRTCSGAGFASLIHAQTIAAHTPIEFTHPTRPGGRSSRAGSRALTMRFCRSSWLLTTTSTDRPTNFSAAYQHPTQETAFGPLLTAVLGPRADEVHALFDCLGEHHPTDEPHDYLSLWATHHDHAGRGLGTALIHDNLTHIDAQRMPVYLESTNPVSLPRYEALGFRRRAEFGPVHGRLITTMWREAC